MPKPSLNLAPLLSGIALLGLALLLVVSTPFHAEEDILYTTVGLSLVAGSALISWGVAPKTASGHWAAAGTVGAAFWAFAVAFAQYFSTCRWVSWLDLAIVFVASVLLLAQIYRIKPGSALLRFALPLALALLVSQVYGLLIRGFLDDPTM